MRGKVLSAILQLLILFIAAQPVYSNGAIGFKGIYINQNGTKTWYKAHNVSWSYNGCGNYQFNSASDFSGQNFGSFTSSQVLQISGFAVVGWTDNTDYVAGRLQYRIWRDGDSEPGTWTEISIGNYGNYSAGTTQVVCTSGTDRIVGYDDGSTNINPGAPGTYNFKIKALGQMQYAGGGGGYYNVNDGSEVTATFTITSSATDYFRSKATGNWNVASNWESSSNNTNWAQSTVVPGSDANSITIRNGHRITLDADVTIKSLVIESDATFTTSDASARTLTINTSTPATTISNSGTWNYGTGASTIYFQGAGTHTISGTVSFYKVETVSGVNFGSGSTIDHELKINSNGFVVTNGPFYGANSTLIYNTGAAYNADAEWYADRISGQGVPQNVRIGTSSVNDSRLSFGTNVLWRQCNGNLTIGDESGTGYAFTLSSNSGGDVKVGGDWIRYSNASFSPNNRAVHFIGSSSQTIKVMSAGTGTETFHYLIINNSGTGVMLSNTSGSYTTVAVDGNSSGVGDQLQLLGTGNLDLNGRTLYLSGNAGGNLLVSGGSRTITGGPGSQLFIQSSKTVTSTSGGSLVTDVNVTVIVDKGSAASTTFSVGSGLTTINGTLQLNNGYIIVNSPAYGTSSLLKYNSGGTPPRGPEWMSGSGFGYPNDVTITNNTTLDPGGTSLTGTVFSLARDLTIDAGSSLFMDYASHNMTVPLLVGRHLSLQGNLSLSNAAGGDLAVAGNWTHSSGDFYPKNRIVTFNGAAGDQTIVRPGGEIFDHLYINKSTSGDVILSNDISVSQSLVLTKGLITTGANKVTITTAGTITGYSSGSYINGILAQTFNAAGSKTFPIGKGGNYKPLTFNYSALTSSSVITAEQFEASLSGTLPAGTSLFDNRYWSVNQSGGASDPYFVTLTTSTSPTKPVVMLKKEPTDITKHTTTAPNYTNASGFTKSDDQKYFALAEDCAVEVISTGGTSPVCYSTLKSAFDAINAGTHTGTLTVLVHGSPTETAPATLNASGSGSASYTSLHLYPTASGLSVSGSLNAPLIDLSGADHVTLDGRVDGTGSTKDLTFVNSNNGTSASTICFVDDATGNTVKYCKIKGATTGSQRGVVFFSTTIGTTGNDDNMIETNDITGDGANRPVNGVYSEGTAGKENSGNEISNNHLYNLFNLNLASNCIHINAENQNWNISGNSIFETNALSPTASVDYCMIKIDAVEEENFLVTGNYLGGNSEQCGNRFNKNGTANNRFRAIHVNAQTSTISSNIIKNYDWIDSGKSDWAGIFTEGTSGTMTIGGPLLSNGNTIGEQSSNGSIILRSGAKDANLYGIRSSFKSTLNVLSNSIGSLKTENIFNLNNSIRCIVTDNTLDPHSITIRKNIIGSQTASESIVAASLSPNDTTNIQEVIGISLAANDGTSIIDSNLVANLANYGIGGRSHLNGIQTEFYANTITHNQIFNLKAYASITETAQPPLVGIYINFSLGGHYTAENLIKNLSNPNTSNIKTQVIGIFDFNNQGLFERNYIHSLSTASTDPNSTVIGVTAQQSNSIYQNNIIYLDGSASQASIYGFFTNNLGTSPLYYNTIVIRNNSSTAFASAIRIGLVVAPVKNNLFVNFSSFPDHYSAYFEGSFSGTDDVDYNNYYGSINFSPWTHDKQIDPQFQNAGGVDPIYYKPLADGLLAIDIPTIPNDFFDSVRCLPSMGAIEALIPVEDPDSIWPKVEGSEPICKISNETTFTEYITAAAFTNGFTWSISNPAAGTIDSLTGVMHWANGFSGSVYIRVDVNGCPPAKDTVRLVVIHDPDCEITGISATSNDSAGIVFTGSPGMSGYSWSIHGNGTITSGATNDSVEVTSGSLCDSTFTLTLTVTDSVGCSSTCTKTVTVTDGTPPTFTAPGPFSFCVIDIQSASYLNDDIFPPRPEHFIFYPEDEYFDVDPASYSDNCCLDEDLILHWEIQFFMGIQDPISGTGQPSDYTDAILFDGAAGADMTHTIRYRLEDCHGNFSAWETRDIVIKPRPTIIKDP